MATLGQSTPIGRWQFAFRRKFPVRLATFFAAALGASAGALALILLLTGMTLAMEFANYTLLALALGGLAAFSHRRGHDWRLGDSAAVLALVVVGLLLCGLVSNVGLRLGMPLADPLLANADRSIGFDTRAVVAYTAANPAVSGFLHLVYNASGILCVIAAGWLLFAGDRRALWRWVVTIVGAMQVTALVSTLFPARGAILWYGLDALQGHGLPVGAGNYSARQFAHFYAGSDPVVTLSKMHGIVTFPSFHTVMALMVLQGFRDTPLRMPAIAWCALTIVSTVPMGGHYVTDLAGGFVVWLGVYLISGRVCPGVAETVGDRPGT